MNNKKPINQSFILASVFFTGMAVLIIEILATRILAPYFGNSIYTFSSVISIVLLALSLGYYIGGRLSDWNLSLILFYIFIFISGFSVIVLHSLIILLLPKISYQLDMITGPLIMSLLLFFLPALLLGLLSPYAIRLLQTNESATHQGKIIGRVFFVSTIGSIIGSLSTGFILIPNFSIDSIVNFVAYGLIVLSTFGLTLADSKNLKWLILAVIFIICHQLISLFYLKPNRNVIHFHQGIYENISVLDKPINGKTMRLLLQDKNPSSGLYLEDESMAFDYTKYYELFKLFTPKTQRFLSIGGGAYSVPKELIEVYPSIKIDTVEIEPSLLPIAKTYFQLPESQQHNNYVQDGRRFIYETQNSYDVIFSDVYRSFAAIPMHFVTQEFFKLVYERLQPQGVFIANVFGSTQDKALILSFYKTIQSVFPQTYLFATVSSNHTGLQNFIFIGHKQNNRMDLNQAKKIDFIHEELNLIVNKELQIDDAELEQAKLFTDFYAPTEYLATKTISQYKKLFEQGIVKDL